MAFSSRSFHIRVVAMAATLVVAATSNAFAQSPNPANPAHAVAANSAERQFLFDNELAMSKMSRGMMVNPTGDVDRDFVAMMIPHHQGAIDMAQAEIKYGHNETLRRLSEEIINKQGQEISIMHHAIDDGPSGKIPSEADAGKQAAQDNKIMP